MAEPDTIRIRLKDLQKQMPLSLKTGVHHTIVLTPPSAFVLDAEDEHFNVDRCVLLPDMATADGSTPEIDLRRMKGLDVLYAALVHADKYPKQGLMVTGHTDRSGSAAYNQKLADARAQNVSLLLRGKRDDWREQAAKHDAVDDYQTAFKWQNERAGWSCDPGPINNKLGKKTRDAIFAFQKQYNAEVDAAKAAGLDSPFQTKIEVDGKVGKETWGAIYDVYMSELLSLLDIEKYAELQARQAKLKAPPGMPDFAGCGEHVPYSSTLRNPFEKAKDEHLEGPPHRTADRRVSLLFFDPGEEIALPCRAKSSDCKPTECPLYVKDRYQLNPIGIPKGLTLMEANLRLTFVDPQGKVRPLPAGIKVEVHFGDPKDIPSDDIVDPFDPNPPPAPPPKPKAADGSDDRVELPQTRTIETGPGGVLQFEVARRSSSLCLRFVPQEQRFVTADPVALDDQKLVGQGDLAQAVNSGRMFFQLPESFTTLDGRWLAEPGLKFKDGKFTDINNKQTQIGSRDKPAELKLDMFWQYFRFDYFDRWTGTPASVPQAHTKGAVPPLELEGYVFLLPADAWPVDSEVRSAWDIKAGDATIHCLGWPRRLVPTSGGQRDLPDEKCTVRFSTPAGGDRLFVRTEGDGKSPNAPRALVAYAPDATEVTTAGAERLRLYDLPGDWRSNDYPVRMADEDQTKLRPFQQAVTSKSAADKPYVASLDTIVLAGTTELEPEKSVVWDDSRPEHRFAIRDNQLAVWKPHADDTYFTKLADLKPKPTNAVLCDTPPFTRLITRGKYLYEVFDTRVAAVAGCAGFPIGARLARRITCDRSNRVEHLGDHFRLLFEDQAPGPDSSRTTTACGHSALGLLRCCGHEDNVERFVFFNYVTLHCDFAPSTPYAQQPDAQPLSAAERPADPAKKVRECLLAMASRWNGTDSFNTARPTFEVGDPVVARGSWHALLAPGAPSGDNDAILKISVFKKIRAGIFVTAPTGHWKLDDMAPDKSADPPGWFTAAHEFGHVMGQHDEYTDSDYEPNLGYPIPTITEMWRSPGEPYGLDPTAMMNHNAQVRTRYYWHMLLWAQDNASFAGTPKLTIQHGPLRFTAAVTPRLQSRAQWPVFTTPSANANTNPPNTAWSGTAVGPLGLCDQMVYVTGHDQWTAGVLGGSSIANPYDGFVVVRVKMTWTAGSSGDYDELHAMLTRANETIHTTFNADSDRRLVFRGLFDGTPVRLRVLFAPRFVCRTFPTGSNAKKFLDSVAQPKIGPPVNQTTYLTRVRFGENTYGVHAEIEVANSGTAGVSGTALPRRALVRRTAWYSLISTFDRDVVKTFSQLIGLPDGNFKGPEDFRPLLNTLLPRLLANPEFAP